MKRIAAGSVLFIVAATFPLFGASWSPTGAIRLARSGRVGVALLDGRFFAVTGIANNDLRIERRSELYDPATRAWSFGPQDALARHEATVTRLADGRVLIAGGIFYNNSNGQFVITNVATLFDPATNTITPTGNLQIARERHTATLLADGRVLISHGIVPGGTFVMTAEVYDPGTGTFSLLPNPVAVGRIRGESVRLANGKVLVTGGQGPVDVHIPHAELFDPAANTFTRLPDMSAPRAFHTATLLLDGRVLIAGGGPIQNALATFEIFDPATNTFPTTGNMVGRRSQHAAGRLPDGRVLVAGGSNSGPTFSPPQLAEVFDPATNTFAQTRYLNVDHVFPFFDTLADGRVLIGSGSGDPGSFFAAEIFDAANPALPRGDWNGDGVAEVFWSNPSSTNENLWFFDPAGTVVNILKTTKRTGAPTLGDFNGDGLTDVIERRDTGRNFVSIMAGYGVLEAHEVFPDIPPASWQIASGADFNGDGTDDLLWVEPGGPTANGENRIWLMNDGDVDTGSAFNDVPPDWAFAATGDFDADGKADILWRNTATGENVIWLMDTFIVKNGNHIETVQDPQYSIAGTGDVNGDGKSDVVWQNNATGAISVWIIDGVNAVDGSHVGLAPGFAVRQVSDLDGDGKADFFLRNVLTGENAVWYLDGFTVRARVSQGSVNDASEIVPPR